MTWYNKEGKIFDQKCNIIIEIDSSNDMTNVTYFMTWHYMTWHGIINKAGKIFDQKCNIIIEIDSSNDMTNVIFYDMT